MKIAELGRLGRLEAARQELEEAGSRGLVARQVMQAAGLQGDQAGGGSTQHFLLQLTYYCAIYENDYGRRYYLNQEIDENFDRRIFENGTDIFNDEEENEL